MRLLYVEEIPFEYKEYKKNKNIKLSDKLKMQFNDYYREIKERERLDINRWTEMAEEIKSAVEIEVSQSGNKKSIYVEDYVQFIFGTSYLFFDKYHLSQGKVSKILGIKPTKFAKLDIFPQRSYLAYTKLDDESKRKSLIPDRINSEGIRIAEYINKNVQAVYACYGFVGVSNDLDFFANISTTDKKFFVLTSPFEFTDDDESSIEQANYAFARYQFALGNQLFDDNDMYVPAGKIKDKIVQILKMEDISVLSPEVQDELIRKELLSDANLEEYMLLGSDYSDFEHNRKRYKFFSDNMKIELENLEDDYVNYYAEPFKSEIQASDDITDNKKRIEADELIRKHYYYYKKEFERCEQRLLEDINISKFLKSLRINLQDWIEIIRNNVKTNVIVQNLTFEEKLKCASCYWISEVFRDYDGSEEFYNSVLTYLGKKSPLFDYFDALNAPPSGKMVNASSQENKNIHVYMRDENMDIFAELNRWDIRPSDDIVRPLMVYMDADSVVVNQSTIDKLVAEQKTIVIVHDKSGRLQGQMKKINHELNLYMKCSEGVE